MCAKIPGKYPYRNGDSLEIRMVIKKLDADGKALFRMV